MSGHHPPCPQCNTGSYEPGRSLTMHLQRYCRGASSTKSMKRSHDDFLTMSCRPTLLQQAIQFNNHSDSPFCLPTISNTLHRAPGLPPSDTLDGSVHSDVYDDDIDSTADDFIETTFDDDGYSSASNESLDHHMLSDEFTRVRQLAIDDLPVENNVELCTFRRNEIFLPPDILFQVKFLSQCQDIVVTT
jgi:hypothetical protein